MKKKQRWLGVLAPSVLTVVAVSFAVVHSGKGAGHEGDWDDVDLCPLEAGEIAGSAVYLFDFRKPLDTTRGDLPGDILRQTSMSLQRNVELSVYLLGSSAASPLVLLSRFCKPYGSEDLEVATAKDRNGHAQRDCNDLPAQIPPDVRDGAGRFCALRTGLERRLDALATRAGQIGRGPENAYLVEAIEDLWLELPERPAPHALHVYSDMMQHAHWYSHLNLDWENWNYSEFSRLLEARPWALEPAARSSTWRVEIFYVPRDGSTDLPRVRRVHQEFWLDHLSRRYAQLSEGTDTGLQGGGLITFHRQSTMRPYRVSRLMDAGSDAEIAAEEQATAEQAAVEVHREREALRREQLKAVRQAEEERRRELARQVEEERQRELARQAEEERQRELARKAEEKRREELAWRAEEARLRDLAHQAEREGTGQREPGDGEIRRGGPHGQPEDTAQARSGRLDPDATAGRSVPADLEHGWSVAPPANPPDLPVACAVVQLSASENVSPSYPRGGRMNFGSAVIAVRYVVDESGETVDADVEVLPGRSEAERDRYFDVFAESALDSVRSWRFAFAKEGEPCAKRQTRTTTFRFSYR